MRMLNGLAALAAMSMAAAPALAAPTTPAASLSVAKSVRTGAKAGKSSELAGAGLIGLVIAAGVVAIGVVAVVNGSDDDDADSN